MNSHEHHEWIVTNHGWVCTRCKQHGGSRQAPMLAGGWECQGRRTLKAKWTTESAEESRAAFGFDTEIGRKLAGDLVVAVAALDQVLRNKS